MFVVETYPPDGSRCEPEPSEHETIGDALADAALRLGRPVALPPDWVPDAEMGPAGARPVGGWHESAVELCGGVAIWESAP